MQKALKILGYALLGLAGMLAAAALFIQFRGIPDYPYAPSPEIQALQVPRGDSARIQRGAAIANIMCKACHRGSDGKLSGAILTDLPPMFGTVASKNITRDAAHGVGGWTDGELYYFLRTGIRKDNSWSPPFMPKYHAVADEDLKSLIAWLRSDDPELAPSSEEYPDNKWNFFVKILGNTLFFPPAMPEKPIVVPDSSNMVALGEYLANSLYGCYHCHSGDLIKVDAEVPHNSFGYYGGGSEMKTREGQSIRTANITPDPETGIGKWTEEQFIQAVKYGQKPGGGTLSYPMAPYTTLTDTEVRALYQFLKTVPPMHHPVNRTLGP
jgi:mono/diheme cytochrome c family protein